MPVGRGRPLEEGSQREGPGDVVLLSGGVDSATALAVAHEGKRPLLALFVDYGQAARLSESRASAAVAYHYQVTHRSLSIDGLKFGPGEIAGRNALLIHLALLYSYFASGAVVIGIHAGTTYRDCGPDFVRLMQSSLDFHGAGRLAIAAPFIDLSKADVFELARRIKVPLDLTYSCEAGNTPCGLCLSCQDREALVASS